MGLDVRGWIEVYDDFFEEWIGTVEVTSKLMNADQNKFLMDYVFGHRTAPPPQSVIPPRGMPEDASKRAMTSYEELRGGGNTWALWSELKDLPWEDRTVEGRTYKRIPLGGVYEVVLTGGWKLIFELMETLAKYHSDNTVRIVVWFG